MKILITGICGFVGSTLAEEWLQSTEGLIIIGIDNFSRPGSAANRQRLQKRGVTVYHGDIRLPSDFDPLPPVDWVIDAAANPSVLAGIDGLTSSRQLVEHNLAGTVNILEYCKRHRSGFILISTSRVYNIPSLASLPVINHEGAFRLDTRMALPHGLSAQGITEHFSTAPPVSLYGSTKLASELLALEYGATFDFPVWINRCGILAGPGQFGRPDQGIIAYWINAYLNHRPLTYTGFGGNGSQVRDCLHPRDLIPLLTLQTAAFGNDGERVFNLGGGQVNAISLAELSTWCADRFGAHSVASDPTPRLFDLPWVVMDSARAFERWQWQPSTPLPAILDEIADHALCHPDWLERSGVL